MKHNLVYLGQRQYYCDKCREAVNKDNVSEFLAGECPAGEDTAGLVSQIAGLTARLNDLETRIINTENGIAALTPPEPV